MTLKIRVVHVSKQVNRNLSMEIMSRKRDSCLDVKVKACQPTKNLRSRFYHSNQPNQIMISLSYTVIISGKASNNTEIRMLDTVAMEAIDKVSEAETILDLTCNLISSKTQTRCRNKTTSVHLIIRQ